MTKIANKAWTKMQATLVLVVCMSSALVLPLGLVSMGFQIV